MDLSGVSSVFFLISEDQSQTDIIKKSSEYQAIVNDSSIKLIESLNFPNEGQFCIILAGKSSLTNNEDRLFNLLKPTGRLCPCESVKSQSFALKIAGFISSDDRIFTKPAYEIGSSVKIEQKKNIWTLDADDNMGDDDLINDEDLLDEQDKVKPDAEELRVCATTKLRKACANCSCGLKEEIEAEEVNKVRENSQNAKSSCGNCYLGDAFRCAACPYRGLPAFKPGEKVTIDALKDDL